MPHLMPPSFQMFAEHDWIDSLLLINNVSVIIIILVSAYEHIQETEEGCKFKTQIFKKTKLMTLTTITQRKKISEILSNVIVGKVKHTVLHLWQTDIFKTCQSPFWSLIGGWTDQNRRFLRGLSYFNTTSLVKVFDHTLIFLRSFVYVHIKKEF